MLWILLQGCASVSGPPVLVVPAEGDEPLVVPTGFGVGGLRPTDTQATLAPACQSDDFDACYRLGVSWRYGAEGVRNVGKARAYYRWACDHELSDACDALERADWIGWGSANDLLNLVGELQESCEAGTTWACFDLADALLVDRPAGAPADPLDILERACARWGGQACDQLGVLASHADPRRVRAHLRHLCGVDLSACVPYARMCAAGEGGPVDLAEALQVNAQLCGVPDRVAPGTPVSVVPPPPPLPPNPTAWQRLDFLVRQRAAEDALLRVHRLPPTDALPMRARQAAACEVASAGARAGWGGAVDEAGAEEFARRARLVRWERACEPP